MSQPAKSPRLRTARRRDLVVGLFALLLLLTGLAYFIFYPAWRGWRQWRQAQQALERLDFPEAASHLQEYLALRPHHAEAHFLLARTWRRAEDYSQAAHHLEQAARFGWIRELIELEDVLAKVQQTGVRGADRALLQSPVDDERVILEAMFKGDRRTLNLKEALRWVNTWIAHFPEDWIPRLWRADLFESFAEFANARDDYQRVLKLKPDCDQALLHLGLIALAKEGDYAKAMQSLQPYLKVHPAHVEALLAMARCYRGLGHLDEAARTALELLQEHPRQAKAALLLAMIALEQGRVQDAYDWLCKARDWGAEPQATHFQFALVLRRLGKPAEALPYEAKFKEYGEAERALGKTVQEILKTPDQASLYHEMGTLYLRLDKEAQAEKWFLRALRQDPEYRPAHQALAALYQKRKGREASRLAEKHRVQAK